MPSLPFRKSLICCPLSASAFCMCMCIQPLHAYSQPYIFRIILYWNQTPLQDHLVLDNSEHRGHAPRIVESRFMRIRALLCGLSIAICLFARHPVRSRTAIVVAQEPLAADVG